MGGIGVVTVLYNSAAVLGGFAASLAAQGRDDLVLYAVDNASRDGSAELLERLGPACGARLELIRSPVNAGVAAGNNLGIAAALRDGCGHVAIVNNDIEFPPGTFAALLAELDASGADMVAPKVEYHGKGLVWFAGGTFSPLTGISRHWGHLRPTAAFGNARRLIGYAPTCFVLASRAALERVGPMDERYFVYFDDTDFMLRARRAGLRLLYVPAPLISHKASASTGGEVSDFSLRYLARNRVYFLGKSYGAPRRAAYLLVYRAVALLRGLRLPAAKRRLVRAAAREGLALWRAAR